MLILLNTTAICRFVADSDAIFEPIRTKVYLISGTLNQSCFYFLLLTKQSFFLKSFYCSLHIIIISRIYVTVSCKHELFEIGLLLE